MEKRKFEYQSQSGKIELTLKDTQTARFKRDYYVLLGNLRKAVMDAGNDFLGIIEFAYPEVDGEVKPRFKEVFEAFLEGDLSKIEYDTDDDSKLIQLLSEVVQSFFG